MQIGTILKKEREKRGLTQQQLADQIKMSRAAYAQYELGVNTPTLDNLMRIADLYGTSIDYLAGRYANNTNEQKKQPRRAEQS